MLILIQPRSSRSVSRELALLLRHPRCTDSRTRCAPSTRHRRIACVQGKSRRDHVRTPIAYLEDMAHKL